MDVKKYDFEERLLNYAASLKELRESHRCLRLIQQVQLIKETSKADELISETLELIKIFVSSIKTAQKRLKPKNC